MAMLITTDNQPIFLDAKTAIQLWFVKTGERKATKEAKAKVRTIAKWYLNRETAPESYLRQHPEMVDKRIRGANRVVSQARLPYKD